jgi:hypothetical protein
MTRQSPADKKIQDGGFPPRLVFAPILARFITV